MSTTLIHLAGPCIQYESLQRQRCSWCGIVIVDDDLSRMAVQISPCRRCGAQYHHGVNDEERGFCVVGNEIETHHFEQPALPRGFPVGHFVELTTNGGFRGTMIVDVEPDDEGIVKVPENSCLRLPAELTGEKDPTLIPDEPGSVNDS